MSVATVFAAGISPGSSWSSVNAHGGCVVYHDGYYYWFGECRSTNKSNGISCYRSKDFYSWTEQGKAVTPTGTMTDENADIASGRTLERPKVFYNATTGKWVMWIHWENGSDYGQAKVAVCQADHVAGPYKLVDVFRPNNHDSRDQTVFVDDDGIAYHVYSTGMNTNTNCSPLEEDYLHPQESVNTQLKGRRYEAASLFKVGETYYGLFSGCTGWNPNPGRYMWTQDLMGDWEAPADFKASDGSTGINFCTDNGKDNTYQSQSNYVFKVPGRDKAFVYMGDRWNSSNIQSSKHVWLPLSVRSGYPAVRWYDEWDLSVFDDMYRYKRVKEIVDGDEYYLLENRQPVGWDQSLPGGGLVVFHIDYDADTWQMGIPNTYSHKRYSIIPANNRTSVYQSAGWPYPYEANNLLTNDSQPAATLFNPNTDGALLMNKSITDITLSSDGLAAFRFSAANGTGIRETTHSTLSTPTVLYRLGPIHIIRNAQGKVQKVLIQY
jgi:hypothetical protein